MFQLNFIESFKSEPRHRSDFHEGTPKYNNNNNIIINILDQIYASFKKLCKFSICINKIIR